MKRAIARVAAVVVGVLAMGAGAMAETEPPKPPPITAMGSPPIIVYYLIAAVGLAICVALAAFPGRRSFED